MRVELTRRQARGGDSVRCKPRRQCPDSPARRIRVQRHASRIQRTMAKLYGLYGRNDGNEVR
jgi:hypothetical protein